MVQWDRISKINQKGTLTLDVKSRAHVNTPADNTITEYLIKHSTF